MGFLRQLSAFLQGQKMTSFILAVILALFESVQIKCEYLVSSEACEVIWKVPYVTLLTAFFIITMVWTTTPFGTKVLCGIKVFWKKRPIISIIIALILFGLIPFPVRCTQTVWYESVPFLDNGMPYLHPDIRQSGKCYSVLSKEYWMPKKPTLGTNTGPLVGVFIDTFDSL